MMMGTPPSGPPPSGPPRGPPFARPPIIVELPDKDTVRYVNRFAECVVCPVVITVMVQDVAIL